MHNNTAMRDVQRRAQQQMRASVIASYHCSRQQVPKLFSMNLGVLIFSAPGMFGHGETPAAEPQGLT